MAREPDPGVPPRSERDPTRIPLDDIALVLLAVAALVLVAGGLAGAGSAAALAAGSTAGVVALVLVARRSMELFVLLVLVLRPAVDAMHRVEGRVVTDPPTVLGAVFVAVSVVWLLAGLLQGWRPPRSWIALALLGLLAASALATLGSDAPARSVVELSRLATAALMFFVVERLCERTGRPDRFLLAVVAAAAVPVAVGLASPLVGFERFEVKDGIERAVSTFTQSNPLGHFLVIVLLVLVAFVLTRPGRPRMLALAAMAPVALVLALTYTRLAWGAAVIGLLVMLWVSGRRRAVPAVLAVLAVVAVVSPDVSRRIDQLTSANVAVAGSESGVGWRLGQWADVLQLADRNPITGIGPDVVPTRLANGQPPHNDVLRAFVELGLVGLVAYLALLAALVAAAAASWRRAAGLRAVTVSLAFVGVVSAFVVTSAAANLLGQVVLLWYVLVLAAAASWVARHGSVDLDRARVLTRSPLGARPDGTSPAPVAAMGSASP